MSNPDEPVFNLSKGMVGMNPELLIRTLWAAIILGFGVALAAGKFAWDANNELRDLHASIEGVGRLVESRTTDRWTLSMQRKYTDEFRLRNPMLAVPDTDDIHQRLAPR